MLPISPGHGPVCIDQGAVGPLCCLSLTSLLTIDFPELFPACLFATCFQYRSSSDPGLALRACPCSNSQDSYMSIPLACPGLFGCVPNSKHINLSPLSLVLSTRLMTVCSTASSNSLIISSTALPAGQGSGLSLSVLHWGSLTSGHVCRFGCHSIKKI